MRFDGHPCRLYHHNVSLNMQNSLSSNWQARLETGELEAVGCPAAALTAAAIP